MFRCARFKTTSYKIYRLNAQREKYGADNIQPLSMGDGKYRKCEFDFVIPLKLWE